MQPWRLLDLAANNAFENMAIDEAMMNACVRQNGAPATIRFYDWSHPAVSIGCLQRIRGNFDLDQVKELGLDTVRRPTGGRAVLHKGDLTYSLVFAEDNPVIPRGVLASYQKISQAVQRGLWRLGIPSQLCPQSRVSSLCHSSKRKISRSPFCFSGVAQYEILVHGKKIMGNAQKRTKGACLQQASIMVEDQHELIQRLFPQQELGTKGQRGKGTEEQRRCASHSEFISLEEAFGCPVSVSLIKEALIRGFEEIFHLSFTFGSLTGWEEEEAARLVQEKYSQDLWNKEGHL